MSLDEEGVKHGDYKVLSISFKSIAILTDSPNNPRPCQSADRNGEAGEVYPMCLLLSSIVCYIILSIISKSPVYSVCFLCDGKMIDENNGRIKID